MDIDLYGPEVFQDPWDALKQVQAQGPVVYNARTGAWMITTDRLVRKVMADTTRFTVEGGFGAEIFGAESFLVIDDKKRHDMLRSIWQLAFQRDSLEAMRPVITEIADRMIDPIEERLRSGETVDAEADLCRHLPAYVIAHMLGVPDEARNDIVRWSDDLANAVVLPHNESLDHPLWVKARQSKGELAEFLADQIEYRKTHPGSDLISQIVHSEIGKTLPREVVVANSRQLLFAGNETTAKWLGHSFIVLAEHPDVRSEVLEDPGLLPAALEEVMRWQPVVMASPRRLRGGDTEVEGVALRDGDPVLPLISAANRDPTRYENPEVFNIHRPFKSNMGFGFGMHSCLGVTLARLEADVVMSRVLSRLPNYQIAGTINYGAFTLRGPVNLPIALH